VYRETPEDSPTQKRGWRRGEKGTGKKPSPFPRPDRNREKPIGKLLLAARGGRGREGIQIFFGKEGGGEDPNVEGNDSCKRLGGEIKNIFLEEGKNSPSPL